MSAVTTALSASNAPLRHPQRLFIGGQWISPSRTDLGIAFGGFRQSGIGREGGREGLHPFLEVKTIIL
jgi:aldehyde dehydrogenase (NAD+)